MKILIIEDDAMQSNFLARMLENQLDIDEIFVAVTLEEAAEILKENASKIDLAFLDLGLPDSQSWHDTYEAISPYTDQIPIIVTTANANPEIAIEVLKHGAEDYIVKGSPKHGKHQLREVVEYACARHQVVEQKDNYMHWLSGSYSVQN